MLYMPGKLEKIASKKGRKGKNGQRKNKVQRIRKRRTSVKNKNKKKDKKKNGKATLWSTHKGNPHCLHSSPSSTFNKFKVKYAT